MGGGVVAAFLENSPQAAGVSRVVLDAPMLSLGQVVDNGARTVMPVTGGAVPTPVIWAAEQIASLRFGLDWSAVDYLDETAWVGVPTLVVHGLDDPTVPATCPRTGNRGTRPRHAAGVPTSTARGVVEHRPHEVDPGRHPVPQHRRVT